MNIKEYYDNYKTNKKFLPTLNDETITSASVKDFYEDCISKCILDKNNVIAWHNMLMRYIEMPDAIYLARFYEKGGVEQNTERYKNRRGAVVRFKDGFSYVFVSNFEAHEIYNMVSKGVVPSEYEFLEMLKTFTFPMHYCAKGSCEESYIAAYPNIGSYKAGVLTNSCYYLAHINDVSGLFKLSDSETIKLKDKKGHVFPQGNLSDWLLDPITNKKIRQLNYSLSDDEKRLVKAHFLRLLDPLNYFLTPTGKKQKSAITNKNIGENSQMIIYIKKMFNDIYGADKIAEFEEKALVQSINHEADGSYLINITYGKNLLEEKVKKERRTIKQTYIAENGAIKIGKYAKIIFEELLNNNRLTEEMISNLMNKDYCSKELRTSFPVLIYSTEPNYRYYKNLIAGKYYISAQWYERSRECIETWMIQNGLQDILELIKKNN